MKTILITGATDGIGLETAKSLVVEGHHVLIHGRSPEKLEIVKSELDTLNPNVQVQTYQADLSDLKQVKSLAGSIKNDHQSLDVIINNAGVFKTPTPVLENGMDVRFMVNTIAPYLLTTELLPLLSDEGRVINLSSAAQAPINFDALLGKTQINDDFQAYAQSKLASTIWSQELAKTLKPKQVMVAVNPGSLLASKMVKQGFGLAGNDISIGSDILVKASLSGEFSGASGTYFDNDEKRFSLPHGDAQNSSIYQELMRELNLFV